MTRARTLVWLIALIAFVVPSLGAMSMAHAAGPAGPAERPTLADCAEHALPPDPCPDQGTAKHAAGQCCLSMSGAVALLAVALGDGTHWSSVSPHVVPVHSLTGRTFSQDPPPPRV